MKKIVALLLALMLVCSAAAFAAGTDIAILVPNADHGWTGAVLTYAEEKAEAINAEGKYTAKVIFTTVMLVRPGVALLAVFLLNWGLPGAWVALVADQCLRTLLITLRYRSGKWQTVLSKTK